MESTLGFLTSGAGASGPLLALDLPLAEVTSAKLSGVRKQMAALDLRLAKKNLHLTYLRMMMHFAVKDEAIELPISPALDLKAFSLSEVPGGSPLFNAPDR